MDNAQELLCTIRGLEAAITRTEPLLAQLKAAPADDDLARVARRSIALLSEQLAVLRQELAAAVKQHLRCD